MILGLTGTNGAGKGSIVDYLVQEKGFAHYSVRDFVVEEVKRRGLELNRTTIGETATDLRRVHGGDYFAALFLQKAKEEGLDNVIIESVRTVAEAEYLKSHGAYVVAIDAPKEVRYGRISGRGSHTDKVSFEDFLAQEAAEFTAKDPNDPSQMNFKVVMENANYSINNDGSLPELHHKIEEMLEVLKA